MAPANHKESVIREFVRQYVLSAQPLHQFGGAHFAALAVTLILVPAIPWYARRRLGPIGQRRMALALACVTASGYWLWLAMHVLGETFDPARHLPGHLCFFTAVVMPLAVAWQNTHVLEVLYYWTFSGVLQASLTPAEVAQPMHLDYFRFWMMHSGAMITMVYLMAVTGWRPTPRGVWLAFAAAMVFLVAIVPVNLLFQANYFFVCEKPAQSALNLLGPWPWYIAVVVFVGLAHFWLAYVPIAVLRRFERN